MLGLPLGFTQPLILLGLLSLPVLWWLLRLVPPRPQVVHFPPARLLFDIAPKEEMPSRTPWWLTLLRLLLAALLIIAAAGPLWNPPVAGGSSTRPILLLIDDGWSAAASWEARQRTADDIVARAETDGRGIALAPLSETLRDISLEPAGAARVRLRQMAPKPYTVERADALATISRFLGASPDVDVVWLSDGADLGNAKAFTDALATALNGKPLTIVDGGLPPARALVGGENSAGALTVKVLRAGTSAEGRAGIVRALDLKGLPLGEAPFTFAADARETEATFDLPLEMRNEIARLEISGERASGAVQLLDKRWRRRTVGLVSGATADTAQPLLAATYYLSRAMNPVADIRVTDRGSPGEAVTQFLEQNLPMIVLADVGNVGDDARARLTRWVEEGGVLVRFAGPHLAAAQEEDLIPVKLRRGGRTLGGSLTWEQPQHLAAFNPDSPFAGMAVPNDVTVTRQVLAEPESALGDRTWATLGDGTPLVTGARRGKGLVVLFHVTADSRWSDLPLSGTFVEMLKRVIGLAGSTTVDTSTASETKEAQEVVPPTRILDGFGAFGPPPKYARPASTRFVGRATANHPPGFYGPPEGLLAVNTLAPADRLAPIDFAPLNARRISYQVSEPSDLRGPVLLGALALLLLDAIVVFILAGGLARMRRRPAVAAIVFAIIAGLAVGSPRANAQDDNAALKAALETHLAYVVTGDTEVDEISKSGLQGLTLFLAQRTALEAGEPIGLDIARDELAFYPLIYWPVVPGAEKPSPQALSRVDAYMKRGGTVLFDTRDAVEAPAGAGGETRSPGMLALREILSGLDIPALEPVPRDHVLTKTFFLLRDFPGRFTTGQLWVEALPNDDEEEEGNAKRPVRAGDGVSSILITSNDFAGAWATRPDGQPMLPLQPGEPRQREFAFRAGVNIVMYTLTGNYKADQVHLPALLERLGQ
ncbi:MAG: DUF4159 domain-containing protein [Variibacter sp.]